MRPRTHLSRTHLSLALAAALVAAFVIALVLRYKSPPEAARLLPESDAIVYIHLAPLRAATHFDTASPIRRSPDFQQFIDATGIEPERDLDAVAFALHRMPDPHGPNGPVAYSEVFEGRFDGPRLAAYLSRLATSKESYAGHDIYTIPVEGRNLRITQLSYDTVAASNMPTAEQIHSMLDRHRASALGTSGSSLLAARYAEVPQLPLPAQAWAIGHIGLPFAENGRISLMGLELPLSEDTDLVASLRYSGSIRLRIEEIAPTEDDAKHTVDTMTVVINVLRGIVEAQRTLNPSAGALHAFLSSIDLQQHKDRAILNASLSPEEVKALAAAATPAAATPASAPAAPPPPAR